MIEKKVLMQKPRELRGGRGKKFYVSSHLLLYHYLMLLDILYLSFFIFHFSFFISRYAARRLNASLKAMLAARRHDVRRRARVSGSLSPD